MVRSFSQVTFVGLPPSMELEKWAPPRLMLYHWPCRSLAPVPCIGHRGGVRLVWIWNAERQWKTMVWDRLGCSMGYFLDMSWCGRRFFGMRCLFASLGAEEPHGLRCFSTIWRTEGANFEFLLLWSTEVQPCNTQLPLVSSMSRRGILAPCLVRHHLKHHWRSETEKVSWAQHWRNKITPKMIGFQR